MAKVFFLQTPVSDLREHKFKRKLIGFYLSLTLFQIHLIFQVTV